MLKLKTRRISKAVAGDDIKYRGVVSSEGVVDFETVLKEVEARRGIKIPEMRYHLETFFDCVRELMLQDGCSRRISDYLLLQLNVRGSFANADDEIDSKKHELRVTARSLGKFCHLERDERIAIANVNHRTRGKAEHVMSVGGDAGTLVFGEDFVLLGHDFQWTKGQYVTFNYTDSDGKKHSISYDVYLFKSDSEMGQNYRKYQKDLIEADETHVLMKWPPAVSRDIIGKKISVAYIDYNHVRLGQAKGSHAHATVVAKA